MLQQAELAKCRLSSQPTASLRIPDAEGNFDDNSRQVLVTREQFQAWTDSLLARTELPIRRALRDARLTPADINEVILVGGATRMPMFVDHVARLFQQPPRCRLNPDEVVALGASVQAARVQRIASVEDLVVTDVAPFTLGVEMSRRVGTELRGGYFLPNINRNTTIPVSRCERVSTVHAKQPTVMVKIYQGEGRRVEENLMLGEFEVRGIPPGPPGQEVDIRFTYDLNGWLEVESTVVQSKRTVTHIVTKHARSMTQAQIAEAVAKMADLKRQPREEAVNRYLLKRAERIYRELSIDERYLLDEMISGFEQILETGTPESIDQYRDALDQFLSRYDGNTNENS